MRLLAIYSTDQILGGGEVSFTLSLKLVQQSGCDVRAVIPAEGPLGRYLDRHQIPYEVVSIDSLRTFSNLGHLLGPRQDWLAVASKCKPDLIHCNSVRTALYGQAVGRKLGIPTIFSARTSVSDGLIDFFLLLRLDAIICISQAVRRRFPRWVRPRKVKVIYNAVDLAHFQNAGEEARQIRKTWLAEENKYLVGVIGRISPLKGQEQVVRAARTVLKQVPETRFVFVGSEDPSFPGYDARLRAEVKRLGLEKQFVFAGFYEDISPVYHALDLVLFPTASEGFGRVIIEAGAAQKPLIASDIDVVREVLSPSLADLTVPVGQADELARRTVEFLKNERLREQTGRRLYEHVRKSFSPEAHRDQLLKLYQSLVQHRAPKMGGKPLSL